MIRYLFCHIKGLEGLKVFKSESLKWYLVSMPNYLATLSTLRFTKGLGFRVFDTLVTSVPSIPSSVLFSLCSLVETAFSIQIYHCGMKRQFPFPQTPKLWVSCARGMQSSCDPQSGSDDNRRHVHRAPIAGFNSPFTAVC